MGGEGGSERSARRLTGRIEHWPCRRDGCRGRSRYMKLGMRKNQAEGFGAAEGWKIDRNVKKHPSPLVRFLASPEANGQSLLCLLSLCLANVKKKNLLLPWCLLSSTQRGLCCDPKSSKLFDCFYTEEQTLHGFLKYQTMQTPSWKISINATRSSLQRKAHYLPWLFPPTFPKYCWLAFDPIFTF